MNIVFLMDSTYPYYTGGIETWIYNVCERMCKNNKITIFNVENYRKDNSMGVYRNINDNVEFVSVKNLNHKKVLKPFIRSYIAVFNSNITAQNMFRAFCRWKKEGEQYYVVALGTLFAAKAVRLIKRQYKEEIISIVSSRSLHPEVLGEKYPGLKNLAMRLEKKNLLNADIIWSNGIDTKDALKAKGFNSIVIRNGVDVKKLQNVKKFDFSEMGLDNKHIVVTIGTVQKIKGYYEIIKAIKILKEKYHFELHLVGVGKGDIEKFHKYAKKNNVEKQIHFTGEKRLAIAYAKSADVVVCLSGGSGFSMAVLESMLSKTPVIAWDSPVYRQLIIDGKNGYLVKAWNPEALAEKIFNSWDDFLNNDSIGNCAYNDVQKFDWSYVIEDIETSLGNYRI